MGHTPPRLHQRTNRQPRRRYSPILLRGIFATLFLFHPNPFLHRHRAIVIVMLFVIGASSNTTSRKGPTKSIPFRKRKATLITILCHRRNVVHMIFLLRFVGRCRLLKHTKGSSRSTFPGIKCFEVQPSFGWTICIIFKASCGGAECLLLGYQDESVPRSGSASKCQEDDLFTGRGAELDKLV